MLIFCNLCHREIFISDDYMSDEHVIIKHDEESGVYDGYKEYHLECFLKTDESFENCVSVEVKNHIDSDLTLDNWEVVKKRLENELYNKE